MKKENEFSYYLTQFFIEFLANQKNVSQNTIKSYRDTFKILFKYWNENRKIKISNITFKDFTKEIITDFLDYLEKEKNNSISTRNQRLAAIHAFCRYVRIENPIYMESFQKIIEIPFKKDIKKVMDYLTPDAVELLLKQPNLSHRNGLRDLLILSLLYDTGARVQEIIDIKIRDIRLESPSIIILHGKGNKIRQVPIMINTKNILKEYIERFNKHTNQFLFESSPNKQFTRKGICYIINKYVSEARKVSNIIPEKIHPHMFRHTKAMHLLQSGINLIYIRDFLGHVDIQTTEIYAKYDTETKRKAIENTYPELVPDNLPDWKNDNDLLQWLNNL